MKRILSCLMVLVLSISMICTNAMAAELEDASKIGQIPTIIGTMKDGVAIAGYIEDGDIQTPVQQDRLKLFGIEYAEMKYVDDADAAAAIKEAYNLLTSDGFNPESLFANLGQYAVDTYDYHAGAQAFVAKEMFYVGMPDESSAEMLNAENTVFKMNMLTSYTDDNDVLVALMKIDDTWTPIGIENTESQTTMVTLPQEGVVIILRADKMAPAVTTENNDQDKIIGPALIIIAVTCIVAFLATFLFKKKVPATKANETAKKVEKKEQEKKQESSKKLSSDGYYDDDDDDDDD